MRSREGRPRAEISAPPSGDPLRDEAAIVDALRSGRHFTVIDALAIPMDFDFAASVEGSDLRAGQGATLPAGRNVIFEARASGAETSEIVLRRHSLGMVRERAIGDGFAERISVTNYTTRAERCRLTLTVDADYADIFELRGLVRERRGERGQVLAWPRRRRDRPRT